MARSSSAAYNYALIFYEVCEEREIIDEVLYEIKSIVKLHDRSVKRLMAIPIISREQKKELLDELITCGYREELINLLKILVDNKEVFLFPQILTEMQELYQEKRNIKIVHVSFARHQSPEVIEKIRLSLEAKLDKFVVLLEDVDESLYGGIKIQYDDNLIDNTVAKYLENIKNI